MGASQQGRQQQRQPHGLAAALALVAAALALLTLPLAHASWEAQEAAAMERLRSSSFTSTGRWPGRHTGTRPLAAHYCQWKGVECDGAGRVVSLSAADMAGMPGANGQSHVSHILLPDLAALAALERLTLLTSVPFATGIPGAWLQPGAFPRLKWLHVRGSALGAQLPAFPPGALPSLETLRIVLRGQDADLPAGWGSPDVLPSLQELKVQLNSTAGLPEAWAHGFRRLTSLTVTARSLSPLPPCETAELPLGRGLHALPPSWARGFPALCHLHLSIGAGGAMPPAWSGAFPGLETMVLSGNRLAGALPNMANRTKLTMLELDSNCFNGTLPAAYASLPARSLRLGNNSLSGPAFPPAWLEAGAWPNLEQLDISGNPALCGTLPANLSWPRLKSLRVASTGLRGTIPAAWCHSLLARSLEQLLLSNESDGLSAQLPPCAASAMPNFAVFLDTQQPDPHLPVGGAKSAAGSSTSRGRWESHATAIGAATLLAGAAALAGARGLWSRRQRRQHNGAGAAQRGEEQQLLAVAPRPRGGDLDEGALLCRQRRLTALLTRQLGQGSLSTKMIMVQALPGAVAHQLCAHECTAGEGSGGASPCAPTAAASRGPQAGQPWGLQTTTLQLQPGELQFVTDASGQPLELGKGAQAVVYQGRLQGYDVAVKVYEVQGSVDASIVWNEAAVLRDCRHARIMPLYGVAVQGPLVLLAMKWMKGGSLRDALLRPGASDSLHWHNWGRQLAQDVVNGLAFLHTRMNCLHGDLKSSNVLIDKNGRACLADLACAKVLASRACTAVGATVTYAAPEQLMGLRCTLAADMFSLGVLLIEIATRTLSSRRGEWRLPRAPDECPQAVVDLIVECLSLDPLRRPTAAQALQCLQNA